MTDQPSSRTQAATPEQAERSAHLSAATPTATGDRYQLETSIAAGGMGEVFRARDLSLHRDVAVKVMHDRLKLSTAARQRFLHEASISGQLQHPNIPPVYDVGTLPDGRPFLAMKLVKGRTLDDHVKHPGPDTPNLVAVFEAVCQAVGYAHSRGVVHRDLKPLNVMVGAFGEVQVMDWGLAKFQADTTELTSSETVVSTFHDPRTADDSKTSAGSILGTPAYMPPEQAIGAVDKITERSDVFGLGAILCVLLTGKPPFVGGDPESTRQLAAQGKLTDAFARLDACGAELELIALAKRCLAYEASDRPANGSEVAAAVAKLRADADARAKRAEVAKATSDTRRRVLAWSAGVVVLVLTAGVGVSVWQWNRVEAIATKLSDFTTRVQQAGDTAAREGDSDARRTAALQVQAILDGGHLDESDPKQRRVLCATEFNRGELLETIDPEAALAAYRRAVIHARALVTAAPAEVPYRSDLVIALVRYGRLLVVRRQPDEGLAQLTEADRLAAENLAAAPTDLQVRRHPFIVANELGNLYRDRREFHRAQESYRRGLAATESVATDHPGVTDMTFDLSVSYEHLGTTAMELGDYPEARARLTKTIELRELVAAREPTDRKYQNGLVIAYRNFGTLLSRVGDYAGATAAFQKGLALNERVTPQATASGLELAELAIWHERLGQVARDGSKDYAAAQVGFEKYVRLLEQAAKLAPGEAGIVRNISVGYNHLGRLHLGLGNPAAALQSFQKSLPIAEQLAARDPANRLYQEDLGFINLFLGMAHAEANNLPDARRRYQQSLDVLTKLVAKSPEALNVQISLAEVCERLGRLAFLAEDDFAVAAVHFQRAVDALAPFDREKKLDGDKSAKDLHLSHRAMLAEAKRMQAVMADLKLLLKEPADQVPALLVRRGLACARRGDLPRTIESADTLIGLRKSDPLLLYDGACLYAVASRTGGDKAPAYSDRAMALLQQAVAAGYRDAAHIRQDEDFKSLRDRADFQKLLAVLTVLREIGPRPRAAGN